MHLSKADKVENGNLVCTILELYAKHLRNQGRKRTLEMVLGCLESANEEFGKLKYEELKLYHVQTWLDKMGVERGRSKGNRIRKWGDVMERLAIDKLQSAFSWAEQQGLVLRNLIDRKAKKALGIRRKGTRGREYVLKPDEHESMVSISKPSMRPNSSRASIPPFSPPSLASRALARSQARSVVSGIGPGGNTARYLFQFFDHACCLLFHLWLGQAAAAL